MKKLLIALFFVAGLASISHAGALNYYVACSTVAISTTTTTADINASHVYVKNILVNTQGTAQTITITKNVIAGTNGNSTVMVFDVPAVAGWYYPLGQQGLSTGVTSNDLIDIPYFTIRTSTSTNPCKVDVIYSK